MEYHNYLLIFTETLTAMVDQINILINVFRSRENVENFEVTEPEKGGIHSRKEHIISIS